MLAVDLTLLKALLNLEGDFDLDNVLLAQKIAAAEAYCTSFIGSAFPDPVPASIIQAVLMLAGFWYGVRETATAGGTPYLVPFGVHDLLQSHRRWVV